MQTHQSNIKLADSGEIRENLESDLHPRYADCIINNIIVMYADRILHTERPNKITKCTIIIITPGCAGWQCP